MSDLEIMDKERLPEMDEKNNLNHTSKEIYLNGLMNAIAKSGCHLFMYYPLEKRCVVQPDTAKLFQCQTEYLNMPQSFADDFVCEEDQQEFYAMYTALDAGAEGGVALFRNHAKTARCKVTLSTILRNANGQVIEAVGLIQNQSEEMLKEQKLDKMINVLSQDYFAVLEVNQSSGETSLMRTRQGHLTQLAEFFTKPRLYSDFIAFYVENMIAGEDRLKTLSQLNWDKIRNELAEKNSYTVRYKRTLAGKVIFLEAKFAVSRVDEGEKICVLAFRQIDDEVRQEEKLQAALAADKAKSMFLATMSHEIRTPLNAVIGFADILRDGESISEAERKEYLEGISIAGNSLLNLINDILDLSKLDAGRMIFTAENFDFRKLLSDVALIFLPRCKSNGLKMHIDIADDFPNVSLDLQRIRQILFNLIGNAVKFTPEGSIVISAVFEARNPMVGTLTFCVRDTGIGISEEDQKNLFNPFVQATARYVAALTQKGTGLGLVLCRRLIEQMGGKITLKSTFGEGSLFTVEFPEIPYTRSAIVRSLPLEGRAKALRENLFKKVLIVDDVAMNLRVLEVILKKCGIEVVSTSSAKDALSVVLRNDMNIDLVLTDLWMPEMNGAELAQQLRSVPGCAGLPIVAVTADIENSKNFDSSLFTEIICKPISVEKIQRMMESVVQKNAMTAVSLLRSQR